jgi:hypothetical protein
MSGITTSEGLAQPAKENSPEEKPIRTEANQMEQEDNITLALEDIHRRAKVIESMTSELTSRVEELEELINEARLT